MLDDWVNLRAKYQYFLNTVPETSLCYGPGLLQEQQAETTSRFMIQARSAWEGRNGWNMAHIDAKGRSMSAVENDQSSIGAIAALNFPGDK